MLLQKIISFCSAIWRKLFNAVWASMRLFRSIVTFSFVPKTLAYLFTEEFLVINFINNRCKLKILLKDVEYYKDT